MVNCKGKMKKIKMLPYPETAKEEITDNYHGTAVGDPYRWLEDDNSQQTADWVAAQNNVTFDYLSQIPYRDAIRDRLTQLWNYPKEGAPKKVGGYYFFSRNNGLQNQSVIFRQKGLAGKAEVFLDPNTLSDDGTAAINTITYSDDHRYMAYSVAKAGSDWVEIFVKDVDTGEQQSDHIQWVKFSGANWAADSKGFYYSRYDEPAKGSEFSGQNRFQKVYYHRLGDNQSNDRLIYSDMKHPLRYFHGFESNDGKYIFVTASEGTHGNEILYRETNGASGSWKTLATGFENDYDVVWSKNGRTLIYTNDGADNYRLAEVSMSNPGKFTTLIANEDILLEGVDVVGGYIIASWLENASSKITQHDMNGGFVRDVELSTIGTATGFDGEDEDIQTFYTLSNFLTPPAVYTYDLLSGESTIFREPEVNYDPSMYVAEQVFFTSADGTQVPMFIVHRKDMKLNGKNPVYLYGYGGFNISLKPGFNPNNIMFMEQGGIYVMVNLRGGGEYGEEWHKGGMMGNKQNVFDDFIAAAEYLIANKYTSSDKLAIAGGSNGGLLVGAVMTQRPDLYAVALPAVGVMDMLRYHKFTIGWGWAVEFGSSEDAEQFEYIYKYSPLHNIHEGVCYPATMVTTADHDDRVVPAHSFKFAAALQAAQGCDRPALIRVDVNAGHGAGKPTSKRIEEAADVYSFLLWNTNTKVKF